MVTIHRKIGHISSSVSAPPLRVKFAQRYQVRNDYARATSLAKLAPHDLRRTCAKLCRKIGGELERIQPLLGHASIQTTEKYLGTEQNLSVAVNDGLRLEMELSLFLNEYNAWTDSTRFVLFLNPYNYALICTIVPQS